MTSSHTSHPDSFPPDTEHPTPVHDTGRLPASSGDLNDIITSIEPYDTVLDINGERYRVGGHPDAHHYVVDLYASSIDVPQPDRLAGVFREFSTSDGDGEGPLRRLGLVPIFPPDAVPDDTDTAGVHREERSTGEPAGIIPIESLHVVDDNRLSALEDALEVIHTHTPDRNWRPQHTDFIRFAHETAFDAHVDPAITGRSKFEFVIFRWQNDAQEVMQKADMVRDPTATSLTGIETLLIRYANALQDTATGAGPNSAAPTSNGTGRDVR